MISKKTLAFLKAIKKNNTREWFSDNKSRFEIASDEFADFMSGVIEGVAVFDPQIQSVIDSPKTLKIFRIYRDVRFSKNKTPYKTHLGAYIAPGGMGRGMPGYYIHLEPGNSFVGGGLHHPERMALNAIRDTLSANDTKMRTILNTPSFAKYYEGFDTYEALKTIPRGFDIDDPAADLLRLKNYFTLHHLTDEEVLSKDFQKSVLRLFKSVQPLNEYLSSVI